MADGTPMDFVVPADIGFQYAKVSGDWNPIHLPYVARLFGMKAPIVHGMWSLGRTLSNLEDQNIVTEFNNPGEYLSEGASIANGAL